METTKLEQIASDFKTKIEKGLEENGQDFQCIPTLINLRKKDIKDGKILVLDWGGTNLRAAIVGFKNGEPVILEVKEKRLSAKETEGFNQDDLFREMADLISELKELDETVTHIGYCFSYPTKSLPKGEAKLTEWTKDMKIEGMVGEPVGEPFLKYLQATKLQLKHIAVINDTVACLLAGRSKSGYDAYIGIIVGTGKNTAAIMQTDSIPKISKLSKEEKETKGIGKEIAINLESGNPRPKYLTIYDEIVDANSDNKGKQLLEKAVSGKYLSEILKSIYPKTEFDEEFDAKTLNAMLNYPDIYKDDYVATAKWIYERSAKLVAASLAGLVLVLLSHTPTIKRILLTAEGSLFWSKNRKDQDYSEMVEKELHCLLNNFGYEDVRVDLHRLDNANLIGAAIAALSF